MFRFGWFLVPRVCVERGSEESVRGLAGGMTGVGREESPRLKRGSKANPSPKCFKENDDLLRSLGDRLPGCSFVRLSEVSGQVEFVYPPGISTVRGYRDPKG